MRDWTSAAPLLLRAGLRHQLQHPWQALLSLTGILMGVAVVLAVQLANQAARTSFEQSVAQLQGNATHRLTSAVGQIPESLYRRLATTPGHPPMAPVITTGVRAEGHTGRLQLVGLDLFAESAFRDALPGVVQGPTLLRDWLTRPDAAVVSRAAAQALGLVVGDTLRLQRGSMTYPLRIVAIHPDRRVAGRDLVLVDIASAQAIAERAANIDHIDLVLKDADEIAWIRDRLPDSVELVGIDTQLAGVERMSAAFELNLTAMSLLALLVGMFLIFNAVGFSVVQRRQLLGRLRALGVTPVEIQRLVLLEAVVLGAVGSLLGALVGTWLGQGLTAIVTTTISELYYRVPELALRPPLPSVLASVLLGIAATVAAAWLPAREAASTPPLTTLSRGALEQRVRHGIGPLALAGGALILLGLLVAIVLPGGVIVGFIGLFGVLIGAAITIPYALRAAHRLIAQLPLSGIAAMAVRDLDRHLSRLATATAALGIALAASIGIAVMVESMRAAVGDWLDTLLSADLYIAASGFEDGVSLPAQLPALAAEVPGVTALSRYRSTRLALPDRRIALVAAELAADSRVGFEFVQALEAPWAAFDRGGVLISEPLARHLALAAGDRIALPTPAGEHAFAVAAVFRDYASEHGRVFMPLATYRSLWQDDRIDTLAVFGAESDPATLYAAASATLGEHHDLSFTAAREIHAESMAIFDRTFRITAVLRYLSLLVACIGVFSALMAVQLERRKEFAVLRALGLTRSQLAVLVTGQSALLGLIAAVCAVPTGVLMAWVLIDAIQLRAFGWSMPFQLGALPLLTSLLLGVAAATLAGLYPAWRSARHDPAPQLRED